MRRARKRVVAEVPFTLETLADQIRETLGSNRIAYTVLRKRSFLSAGEGVISQIGVYRTGRELQIYLDRKPGQTGTQLIVGCPLTDARMEVTESELFPGCAKIMLHFDKIYTLELDAQEPRTVKAPTPAALTEKPKAGASARKTA